MYHTIIEVKGGFVSMIDYSAYIGVDGFIARKKENATPAKDKKDLYKQMAKLPQD